MIDHTAVIGQFKGRVLHAYGLIYAAWLAVSDFMVDMFHAENIAKLGYRWQPVAVKGRVLDAFAAEIAASFSDSPIFLDV